MSKKKYSRALEYFQLVNQEKEYYQFILQPQWLTSLARFSQEATEKILKSPSLKEGKGEEEEYWYLELEKKFSICVHELQDNSGELSAEDMITYNQLIKELLETGYTSEEAQQAIFQPLNWEQLTETQKRQAQKVFIGFASANGSKTNNATVIMKRIIPNWTSADTGYLAEEMSQELLDFYEKEQTGWKGLDSQEREEEKELSPQPLTTVPEKLVG